MDMPLTELVELPLCFEGRRFSSVGAQRSKERPRFDPRLMTSGNLQSLEIIEKILKTNLKKTNNNIFPIPRIFYTGKTCEKTNEKMKTITTNCRRLKKCEKNAKKINAKKCRCF